MSFVNINSVSFTYPDGTVAIDNISLSIEKGEKVAIVGQNGAGKTTAVKMMNGLLKPTLGDIIIDGWNTKDYTVAKMSRKVGYVFQNPMDQIFHNNVYDEIEFGPKKIGYSESERKKLIETALELTELSVFSKENPYNLPYSIRKFVTIASIIAMDTDVIIMDEPTAGQDLKGIKILNNLIKKLSEKGKTIITITHDMEFVINNFNRVVVMANKKIIEDGDKRKIFWNEEVLKQSKIKQPYISELAKELSMKGNVLSIDEFINEFKKSNIEVGEEVIKKNNLENISFVNYDCFDKETYKKINYTPNIVIISGVFELFEDNNMLENTISGVAEILDKNGAIIYTGQPWHPQLKQIALVLNSHKGNNKSWLMRRRSEKELDSLFEKYNLKKERMLIDNNGIFTVSLAELR